MNRYYAGIGSRETPVAVLEAQGLIAQRLAALGWTLRSGGAQGADTAFENGAREVGGGREIFLPAPGFNGHRDGIVARDLATASAAEEIAQNLHPAWSRLSSYGRLLMTRNVMQVLGANLRSPVRFVVCWAKGSKLRDERVVDVAGGTGLAVRLAATHGIDVFNLAIPEHATRIEAWLRTSSLPMASVIGQ